VSIRGIQSLCSAPTVRRWKEISLRKKKDRNRERKKERKKEANKKKDIISTLQCRPRCTALVPDNNQ
jgi:hypothetical protein